MNDLRENAIESKDEMIYSLMEIVRFVSTLFPDLNSDEKKKCDKAVIRAKNSPVCVATAISFIQICECGYLQQKMPTIRKEIRQSVDYINGNFSSLEM